MLCLNPKEINQMLRKKCCRHCPRFHTVWFGRSDQCDTNTEPLECYELREVSDQIFEIDRNLFFAREEYLRRIRELRGLLS